MEDVIYLIVSPDKVERMVKTESSAMNLKRNEIPVKLTVHIDSKNWEKPFIEKEIHIERFDNGIGLEDVKFEKNFITEEEAEMIRQSRLEKMKGILEGEGFTVSKMEGEDD